MKVFDAHAHIYPAKIAEKAVESIGAFYTLHMSGSGTPEKLLEKGSAAGVTDYIVHSVATTPGHVTSINNFILGECEKHGEFHGFGTMHVDFEDKISECERVFAAGLKGMKLHPDIQRFALDDERMMPFYDYLRAVGKPVCFHCGDYRYDYSHPRRLKRLLHELPGLKVLAAHFGGWSVWDLAVEFLEDEDCYMDTSSSFAMLGPRRSKELVRHYGAGRLLWGTDFPMWDASEEMERLKALGLDDEEMQLILHKNAEKLLGLMPDGKEGIS